MTKGSWPQPSRRRGSECLSDLTLDRLLLGELPGLERQGADAHLATCPACAQARGGLETERQRFLAESNVGALAADALARAAAAPPRLQSWLLKLGLPLTLAVGAAALMLVPRPQETRTKGAGFSLATYVLHAEAGGPGTRHGGEPVHPGDQLQFRFQGERGGHLAVIAIDGAAKVSVYYPPGPTAERVEAGREVPLRTAVELDSTLGAEVVVGLLCDRPLPVADIVAAAQGRPGGPLGLPCAETRQRLVKEPRP